LYLKHDGTSQIPTPPSSLFHVRFAPDQAALLIQARPKLPPISAAPRIRLYSSRPLATTPVHLLTFQYFRPATLFCTDTRSSHFSSKGRALWLLRLPVRLHPASMAIDLQVERATRMALRLVLPSGAGPIPSSLAVRLQQRERSNHSLGIVINTDFRLLEQFLE
jgi:hypothetical protein